jgi:hypothetical protein
MISKIVRLVHPVKAITTSTLALASTRGLNTRLGFSFAEENKKPSPNSSKDDAIDV